MFDLTEKEIMAKWGNRDFSNPMVSIRCTAFNHEKYIARALESFLSQKTNFPFEIIIHDDASMDSTADVIRSYEAEFPHIVKPIYEKENVYSKDRQLLAKIMNDNMHGKYIAICEGDDYWCDSLKLQKQVDFMEKYPNCSLCTHNTLFHYLDKSRTDHNFNQWNEIKKLSLVDIFFGWNVHTSSYMLRNGINYKAEFSIGFWSGDYVYITVAKYYGEVYCLPEVMSVYNANVVTGVTFNNAKSSYEANIKKLISRITYLDLYNDYTKGKFKEIVEARKAEIIIKTSDNYDELRKAAKIMSSSPYFSEICESDKSNPKIKNIWKYKGYIFGKLWYLTVIAKHNKEKKIRN